MRKELSPTLYPPVTGTAAVASEPAAADAPWLTPEWKLDHMEHCIDHLRQVIMCHGDLTPAPLYSWEGFGIELVRSGSHTCRKWEPIQAWMAARSEGKTTVETL